MDSLFTKYDQPIFYEINPSIFKYYAAADNNREND